MRLLPLLLLAASLLTACAPHDHQPQRLPILGERDAIARADGGPADTIYYQIPPFRLTDQAGQVLTNQSVAGRAYVVSFFFATCPDLCPRMHRALLQVYTPFATDKRVTFLSHTIDPAHDSIPVLREYAHGMGVQDASRWHFATTAPHGETATRDTVIKLAHAYFTAVMPDKDSPGSVVHNGTIALVDDQGHIRGVYDSLDAKEMARLLRELPILLAEIDQRKGAPVASK